MSPDELLQRLGAIFHIGSAVQTADVILISAENASRRSACLSGIEHELFTDARGDCPMRWGADRDEYVEQMRAALAKLVSAKNATPAGRLPESERSGKSQDGFAGGALGSDRLHAAIMNLPCTYLGGNAREYREGHRDARHAAAELASAAASVGVEVAQKPVARIPAVVYTLEAMVRNYGGGHQWDHLDSKVCTEAAQALRDTFDDYMRLLREKQAGLYASPPGPSVQPQSVAEPGEGAMRSARLKILADTYACTHADGRAINTGWPSRQILFAEIDALCVALDSPPAHPSVQAGWRLVPVEPTRLMQDAAESEFLLGPELFDARLTWADKLTKVYRAMLAATPLPPQEKT